MSPSIVTIVKPRRIWWSRHGGQMREEDMFMGFWQDNVFASGHLENQWGAGRITDLRETSYGRYELYWTGLW